MLITFLFRLSMIAFVYQVTSICPSYAIVIGSKFNVEESQEMGSDPTFSPATRVCIARKDTTRTIMAAAYEGHLITAAHNFNEEDFQKVMNTDGSVSYLPLTIKDGDQLDNSNPINFMLYDTETYNLPDGSCVGASSFKLYTRNNKNKNTIPKLIGQALTLQAQKAGNNIEAVYISDPYEKEIQGLEGRIAFIKLKIPVERFKGSAIGRITDINPKPFKGFVASYHIHGKNTDENLNEDINDTQKKHIVRMTIQKEGDYFTSTNKLLEKAIFPHQFDDEGCVDSLMGITWLGDSGTPLFGKNKNSTFLLGICTGASVVGILASKVIEEEQREELIEEIKKDPTILQGTVLLPSSGARLPVNSNIQAKRGEIRQHFLSLESKMGWIKDCLAGRMIF